MDSLPTWKRLLFGAIVVVFCGALLEGLSNVAYHHLPSVAPGLWTSHMDPWERHDPVHPGNWLLVPGFRMTLDELLESKAEQGKVLAVEVIRRQAAARGFDGSRSVYPVNRDGFKGPELDRRRRKVRILTIGDSCTVGSVFDEFSYPRVLEQELRARGYDVEVVNGGVESYKPANVLMRIEDYKALRPEVTTIYIGWNALWDVLLGPERPEPESRPPTTVRGSRHWSYTVRLVRRAIENASADETRTALAEYHKPKRPDPDDPMLDRLSAWQPSFLPQIERIVDEMESVGSRVVLMTLPGLYLSDRRPTEQAMQIGHLPSGTDNPLVLGRLTERYNEALRRLARRRGLQLIDLETWSRSAFEPRDAFFVDSVHLLEQGQAELGRYLADRLDPDRS